MKSVVVTGASTGIGLGVVKVLIQNGYRVFGSVRKQADAERLKANFGDAFTPLIFDVTDEAAVQAAAEQVRSELGGETLFGLVNNAGVATPAPIMHQPIADFRSQMEINLVGQLIVSQAFIPLLGADRTLSGKPGRIVNMSSVSGKRGSPFVGAYVASKHALEGLSETMRIELMLYGIDVIIVGPGAVATPIWDKAEQVDLTPYQNSDYLEAAVKLQKFLVEDGRKGYPPEKVGEVVLRALTATRPRVRYSVVPNALKNWVIPSLLPKRLMDLILAKALGFKK
ncbi:MAG: SDR family NAD(P)-dependent oxidoreductase [Anaerolineales bacterium]|nr:SDR family NAD(P)-dependent oxidoreductase [Anaerolineales bacterium]MBP6210928.1 SDR family NAD(P)-dependent oxidoreductase [Anaerolineales bacterium]MBP8164702.1 SDR family NAD(P)-dependent oxidoreductase [Anaerolineales bacterium]